MMDKATQVRAAEAFRRAHEGARLLLLPNVWDGISRIVRTVRVPVTADIEAGYGATPAQVARSVTDILGTGVVGFNIEDGMPRADEPVRPIEDAVARIRAAREAAAATGVPAVINVRIDLYTKNVGDSAQRFEHTVRREKEYLAAGPIASIRSGSPTSTPSPAL